MTAAEERPFDPGVETWVWNSSARCDVGRENEATRRVEKQKRAGKMSNAAFPLGRRVIRGAVRCIAREQAVDDLEEAKGGGFVFDPWIG